MLDYYNTVQFQTVSHLSLSELRSKKKLDELINIPTKAEERSMT